MITISIPISTRIYPNILYNRFAIYAIFGIADPVNETAALFLQMLMNASITRSHSAILGWRPVCLCVCLYGMPGINLIVLNEWARIHSHRAPLKQLSLHDRPTTHPQHARPLLWGQFVWYPLLTLSCLNAYSTQKCPDYFSDNSH